jgi:holdfast attachment protein HfaA
MRHLFEVIHPDAALFSPIIVRLHLIFKVQGETGISFALMTSKSRPKRASIEEPRMRTSRFTPKARMLMSATLFAAPLAFGLSHQASAQSMGTSAASYEAGYGSSGARLQTAVDPSTRDANGNRVILDGVMVTGLDNSVYARSQSYGAGDSYSGAGALGGASAIGNNLQVTVNGNYNTVVVNSTQTNTGNITATTASGSQTTTSGSSLNGTLSGF